ncbi:hypothetical protein PR202_ga07289 [Eleusine coracana subsp. coracana]|uniref:Uncharacterized protein n=1 Tax=Eleusine coracana subsp. coracana TaxID=191504 RepID=A0AAV5BX39_ELECO|nr:hypothetical protein PR202_ga07289 [Eleusine coracana subsp. coracana]
MVLDTLRDPMPAELPPLPPTLGKYFHAALLPDDEEDDATTCYHVDVQHVGCFVSVEVVVLRSGVWSLLCSPTAELASPPERFQ